MILPHKNNKLFPDKQKDDWSGHAHRQLIGSIGLFLPLLLWLVAGLRSRNGQNSWEVLRSVSAYYHTGAVAVFAGALVALAVFFFTYKGYHNAYYRRDRIAAITAGVAAILVAVFPTSAPTGFPTPTWWTPLSGDIHDISALILFGTFIFFAFFQFPKTNLQPGQTLPIDKRIRNTIYKLSALIMFVCIVWVVIAAIRDQPIFLPEVLALEFFCALLARQGPCRPDREGCKKKHPALFAQS